MGLENFIPKVLSAFVIEGLRNALVYGFIANRDFEGEAKIGGTVQINEIGDITISDYTKYTDMTFQTLDGAALTLKIDQQKSFSFTIDQIDAMFTKPNLQEKYMSRGGYKAANTIDNYIAGLWEQAGITTSIGTSGTPIEVSAGNAVEYIGKVGRYMTDAGVQKESRWGVLPPWYTEDIWSSSVSKLTDNVDTFKNGYVGNIRGIKLYESPNVDNYGGTKGTSDKLMFGVPSSLALAVAISGDIRVKEPEKRRGVNVDGLFVYGAKVVRPDTLACLSASEHE